MRIRLCIIAGLGLFSSGCGPSRLQTAKVTVAAASNFQQAFAEIARAFEEQTGVRVVTSYASTAQLAHQIANGAPFDVFASADVKHVNDLVSGGHLVRDSRRIFARGSLVLWVPKLAGVRTLHDLTKPEVRLVALANPETAPYGRAAREALESAGVWQDLRGRLTFTTNINMARQLAATGNVDAALTARSLIRGEPGYVAEVGGHAPLDHAAGAVTHGANPAAARRFLAFLSAAQGASILARHGYRHP